MCTCIAEIKASYMKVRRQTDEVARHHFDVDDYLDQINVVRKELAKITEETNSLVDLVRSHFTEIDVQETTELLAHSVPILILMDHLQEKLMASSLRLGLNAAIEQYRDCVSDFQELCSDLQVFNIDIPRNPECLEAERQLCEILKR